MEIIAQAEETDLVRHLEGSRVVSIEMYDYVCIQCFYSRTKETSQAE